MHVLLRYIECTQMSREERVKDTLSTMGASILLGGLSTFLGALPLVFCTSAVLRTVFTCFFSMVVLGVSHGLVFLPVLLSLVGPVPSHEIHSSSEGSVKEETTSNCQSSDASDSSGSNPASQSGSA